MGKGKAATPLSRIATPSRTRTALLSLPLAPVLGFLTLGSAITFSPGQAGASIRAAIVVDQRTGRVYRSFNANLAHAPASLAKIMTLYLTFDAIKAGKLRMNQRVRVSRRAAARSPSKLYLRAGSYVRIRTLVYGTAVASANDAATVLAEKIAGSEHVFAQMMTMKARELGMWNTVFRTASGLPARGQRTTARDMAVLTRALRRDHPRLSRVFSVRAFQFAGRYRTNTNRLLHRFGAVDGLKTGYTRRARFNLVTTATNGRRQLIIVVLGGSSSNERYRWTTRLMAAAWRQRPGRTYVVARRAVNRFRPKRSRRLARTRTRTLIAHANRGTRSATANVAAKRAPVNTVAAKRPPVTNVAARTAPVKVITKKTLVDRRRERRDIRINLGGRKAHAAISQEHTPAKPKVFFRREIVLHLGSNRRARTASRRAARAMRKLPGRYRRGARVRVAAVRARSGRIYRAQIAYTNDRRAARACGRLKQRGIRCRVITRRVPILSASARRAWRGSNRGRVRQTISRRRADSRRTTVRRTTTRRGAGQENYAIQVAAGRKVKLVRKAVRRARRVLPRGIRRGTRVAVLKPGSYKGRMYRARIVGMTRKEARKACRILSDRKIRCMAIRHKA